MLYINPKYIITDGDSKTSPFINSADGTSYEELKDITPYDYQISILKDGKEVTFCSVGDTFVSQQLTSKNTIYIKWVKTAGTDNVSSANFGISLTSCYDNSYDMRNDGFDKLELRYDMTFNRQRTVESVSYIPVTIEVSPSLAVDVVSPDDVKNDWQFYFTPEMLDYAAAGLFYGIKINDVRGLNNTYLTENELANINLDVSIIGSSFVNNCLGVKIFNKNKLYETFEVSTPFNYISVLDPDANVIILGKVEDVAYGEYELNISQTNKYISSRNIKIYKALTADDISVSVPNADYDGDYLRYEQLTSEPGDFSTNYASYYEYVGGKYVPVTSKNWSRTKTYYTKQYIKTYNILTEKPEDFETNYANYYTYDEANGNYVSVTSATWDDEEDYYQKSDIEFIDTIIDVDNAYILSASSTYIVDVDIKDDAFVGVNSKSANAEFVGSYEVLTVEPADFTTSYSNYYKWDGGYTQLTSAETFVSGKYYKKLNVLTTNLSNIAQSGPMKDEIVTGNAGTFNATTGQKNYIKITYTIVPTKYDYYQISEVAGTPQTKSIYIYIYEPLKTAAFNKTMLYKYDYDYKDSESEYLLNSLREELGTEQLKIKINGLDNSSVLNYVDVVWMPSSDGVNMTSQDDIDSATYQFSTINGNSVSGTIYAVITQFGVQYSIQCGYHVSDPILTERVILNTPSQAFKTGSPYINMKLGQELIIDAEQYSSLGDVTVNELYYITCNMSGAQSDGIISYDNAERKLVANKAGRAKLVIVSKDALKENLYSGLNYLNTSSYVRASASNCVLIVDIIVSDGSEGNPYLIATADDFRKITDDFVDGCLKS